MLSTVMLAGCGRENAGISGQITPQSGQAENETEKQTEAEPEDHKLSFGRIEGGVYENSYAGFGCELDSDWTFYSAEELQELPEDIQELFADSELGGEMENYPQISDMMAENTELLGSVNVLYTKMNVKERLAYMALSEEELIDTLLEQQDSLSEAYTQAGINVESMEKAEVTFLGEKHMALHTTAESGGYAYFVTQVFDYTRGQYGVTLTASSYLEDSTEEMLELFYKVD